MTSYTRAQALKLYATACETHRRQDWRLASHALAYVLQGASAERSRPPAKPKPEATLCDFLSLAGLQDAGGELRAMDAEIWHKGAPFRRRLVRDDGRSLELAAQAAWEAGYFPDKPAPAMDSADNMQAVTAGELLEAIRRELAGAPPSRLETGEDYWQAMEDFEQREAA